MNYKIIMKMIEISNSALHALHVWALLNLQNNKQSDSTWTFNQEEEISDYVSVLTQKK